ncbi:hypothetical protein MASR1M50_30400 [Burkholderiales bacterium]
MTDVAFHFNVPDKLGYACRLLRKAHAAGGSVGVVAAPVVLQELDARLWSFSALDFVPHCLADAPAVDPGGHAHRAGRGLRGAAAGGGAAQPG